LETGQITEADADAREKELLDRLEIIEARGQDHDGAEAETDAAEHATTSQGSAE
jgi:hypothetical protein